MSNANSYFSSNTTPRQVDKAWSKYVNSGVLLEDSIRGVIGDSWVRCNKAGVDPGSTKTRICLNKNTYQSILCENSQLIEAAKPVMEEARQLLAESGSMMILADKDGVCLHVEGDRKTVEDGHEIDLCKGANWSEYAAGTNAIGTVLSVKKPVKVNTTEHFCQGIKSWSCAAMVIRDPGTREVIGVLDLSGLSSNFNHHALALVVEAAGRIETSLVKLKLEESNRLLDTAVSIFPPRSNDALMLLDKNGYLIKANKNVSSYLAARGINFNTDNCAKKILDDNCKPILKSDDNWLNPEWIVPVMDNDEKLGSVICIPPLHRHAGTSDRKSRNTDFISSSDEIFFENIVGSSAALRKTIKKAKSLAASPVPILIHGETGVGKEIFAKAIHASSKNRNGPLIALNCGGLSHELISSELFGYAESAFTGADPGGKIGKIEAADGGTLFLDEIG
ncbi:MAG: sigma 54-interacting transcriptional regulator, partial [Proteobacteria bacterium]|nr:sigma 54-interacting transcriptional regulator [Pseudomonadota bacterium]